MTRLVAVSFVLVGLASAGCQRPAQRAKDAAPSPAAPVAQGAAEAGRAPAEAEPAPVAAPPAAGSQPAPARESAATREAAPLAPAVPLPVATPAPTPTPRPRLVASGTALPIVLRQALSSKSAKAEDPVAAELAQDVIVDGEVLLPRGSELSGHVVSAQRSGRVQGRARLVVAFDRVHVEGRSYTIEATAVDVTAGSSKGKDAKIAGGAAATGVVIGAIADGGSGAVKGGLIGGAVGGAAVLATRGVEVELSSGSSYTIKLEKGLRLR